jgi:hypothetical protein
MNKFIFANEPPFKGLALNSDFFRGARRNAHLSAFINPSVE